MKQDMQRQQLRELLAKQTLQRQKQKEEKERIMRGGEPLRHWGQDDPGTPPAGQFPHGPGFPFGEEGGTGEPRAPPPGYPGAGQMQRMHGPMAGGAERWPQQQMVRPPHPGQVRPDMVPGYNEMGMRGGFPPGMRGMRVPQQAAGYPGMPASGATSPGAHPGPGYPGGQFPQQRHPGQQFMDPIRAQMYQEHLRRTGQMGGPRHRGMNPLDPYDHLVRTPGGNMPPRPSTSSAPNNQHGQAVRQQHPHLQQQLQQQPGTGMRLPTEHPLRPSMPGEPRPGAPQYVQRPGMPRMTYHGPQGNFPGQTPTSSTAGAQFPPGMPQPGAQVRNVRPIGAVQLATAQAGPVAGQTTGADDEGEDHLQDLLGEDGTFNLLEYADDLALDTALDVEQDKSIFDEHLGIAQPPASASTPSSTVASTAVAPKATSAAAATATTIAVTSPSAVATTASSVAATAPTTSTTQPSAVVSAPVVSATSSVITASALKSTEEAKAETGNIKASEDQAEKSKTVPPPLPKVEQIPSPQEKTPGSASSDFQAKFLEFSQRGKPPSKDGGEDKGEKPAASAEESGEKSTAGDETAKESKEIPQLDGMYDALDDDDDDDAYDADDEYTIPQLDGWFDDSDQSENDEVCEILQQVDGPGDPPEQPPAAPPQGVAAQGVPQAVPSASIGGDTNPGPPLPPPQQPGSAPNSAPPTPTPQTQQGGVTAPMPSQSPQQRPIGSPMGVRPQMTQSGGQSPYAAPGHMSPRMPPVASPHASGPPPYPMAHRQSPHPSQSPHHSGPSPGPMGMSPRNVPCASPHPSQSPHGSVGTPQGAPPHYPPVPSPMGMHGQAPGVPSPHPVQSPHPHSRSTTPQMSPRGSHSQPGTPQLTPTSTPATPGISAPTTPTANTPNPLTPTSQPPMMMSSAAPMPGTVAPPATVAGMIRGPRPPMMQGMQQQAGAPGQMQMVRPDDPGSQPLSHFPVSSAGAGVQNSLSQLAAMTQAPRPSEGGAPTGMPPGAMMSQQRPGMRPSFMPGQMPGQHPQGMQGMPGQPGMPPRSVAGMMNQPRSMAPSTMVHNMQDQQNQMSMAPGQQGMGFGMRPGMPPVSQGQQMFPQQPGQQFQRMQGMAMRGMAPGAPQGPGQPPGMMGPRGMQPQQFQMRGMRPGMRPGHPGMPPDGQTGHPGMPHGGPVGHPGMPQGGPRGHPGMPPGSQAGNMPPQYPGAQVAGARGARPVLIQPLLLEDLLEQEKQEQRRQQEQAMMQQKQERDGDVFSEGVPGPRGPRPAGFPGGPRMPGPMDPGARMQHPEGWPQAPGNMTSPRENMSPHGMPGFPGQRPGGPQLSPRTPSPFPSVSPSGMYPPSHSPAMQSPIPPPPTKPPVPTIGTPGEPPTEDERRQQMSYEEWMLNQAQWLNLNIKQGEQQMAKFRKTKKSLNAKSRQAKKNGGELSETDQAELDKTNQEQGVIQKQLEGHRKQQRQHQTLVQEYRMKQQERYGPQWGGPPGMGPMGQMGMMNPGGMPPGPGMPPQGMPPQGMPPQGMPPQGMPQGMPPQGMPPQGMPPQGMPPQGMPPQGMPPQGMPPQGMPPQGMQPNRQPHPAQPRMPGAAAQQAMRLPSELSREYETYMQKRLQMMNQSRPTVVTGDENNPFSDTYQQKMQEQKQMEHQLQQHIEHQKRMAMIEGGPGDVTMTSPTGQPMAPGGGVMVRPSQGPNSAGVEQQSGFPFQGSQPQQQTPMSSAGQVQGMPSSMPGAMTTMQQVVSQLRSPPQSAVPGMPTGAGAQVATSTQLQMAGSHMPGSRMQGIRVQGPPMQPGQQVRVRIQGGQPGQGQRMQVFGGQQLNGAQASGQQHTAGQAGGPAVNIPGQSVQLGGVRPRGPPGYPGNQPPRFAAPGMRMPGPEMGGPGGITEMIQRFRHQGPGVSTPSSEASQLGISQDGSTPRSTPGSSNTPPSHAPGSAEGEEEIPRLPTPPTPPPDLCLAGTAPMGPEDLLKRKNKPKRRRRRKVDMELDLQGMPPGEGGMTPGSAGPFGGMPGHPLAMLDREMAGVQPNMSELQKLVNMQPAMLPPDGQGFVTTQVSDTPGGLQREDLADLELAKKKQNVLLKQLLAMPGRDQVLSSLGVERRSSEDDDGPIQLTPEQQKQLALIESMPLTMETEISQEEWAQKTPEEKERIMELRRQEFERRKKQLEEFHKKKPVQRRKPKRPKEGETGMIKKRRKGSVGLPAAMVPGAKPDDVEVNLDQVMAHIRSLPPVPLQEPDSFQIAHLCAAPGAGIPTCENGLRGMYGHGILESDIDFYDSFPFASRSSPVHLYPQGLQKSPVEIAQRRRFLTDGQAPFTGKSTSGQDINAEQQRYSLTGVPQPHVKTPPVDSALQGLQQHQQHPPHLQHPHLMQQQQHPHQQQQQQSHHPQQHPLLGRTLYREPIFQLPSPPLIEPRLTMSRASDQSPATVVSASSPEVDIGEHIKVKREGLPGLRLISMDEGMSREERERECKSPEIPVCCPVPVKVSPSAKIKLEKEDMMKGSDVYDFEKALDKENLMADIKAGKTLSGMQQQAFREHQNQVSVTLTLSQNAAEDVGGVINAIADLLKIAVPPSYEISRSPSPEHVHKVPAVKKKLYSSDKEDVVNIQSLIRTKPRYCRHCDVVVLSSGIKKKVSEMSFMKEEEQAHEDEEVTFCSMNCYMQFAILHQTASEEVKSAGPGGPTTSIIEPKSTEVLSPGSDKSQSTVLSQQSTHSSLSQVTPGPGFVSPGKVGPPPQTATGPHGVAIGGIATAGTEDIRAGDSLSLNKLRRRSSSTSIDSQLTKQPVKKWCGSRYRRWDMSCVKPEIHVVPPTEAELNKLMDNLNIPVRPSKMPGDSRKCILCHGVGDEGTNGPGRLLNMDVDRWVHLNCALWSYEVYETLNGALMNVDQAIKRGLTVECVVCHKKGATMGCFKLRCTNLYHVKCAQQDGAIFFHDKGDKENCVFMTLLCHQHVQKQVGPIEGQIEDISVYRRVYVNRDENKQVASIVHQDEKKFIVRIGSLVIHNIGQLLPHQLQSGKFHNIHHLYPVGFKTSRFYWSFRQINKKCRYMCRIDDTEGAPEFVIKVVEEGLKDMVLRDKTAKGVWQKILEPFEKMRVDSDLVKCFPSYLSGEDLFGLTEPTVIRIVESLPGVEHLTDYGFKFGRSPLIELPLALNPTGSARSEPKLRTHFKRLHTFLKSGGSSGFLPSTVNWPPSDISAPYMKQFVHSKSQQYRRLKMEWRNNVFLRRSGIQGLGLFAARDLEKHTMVIEYIGELIRNEVAEYREKLYDSQNRGTYMFRIDESEVIDATMCGGPARYVNHSCNPCCMAEVVSIGEENKIIIIAKRRISRGEELTYDYKFDFEDEAQKIPCLCGAPNCRKWMN